MDIDPFRSVYVFNIQHQKNNIATSDRVDVHLVDKWHLEQMGKKEEKIQEYQLVDEAL